MYLPALPGPQLAWMLLHSMACTRHAVTMITCMVFGVMYVYPGVKSNSNCVVVHMGTILSAHAEFGWYGPEQSKDKKKRVVRLTKKNA